MIRNEYGVSVGFALSDKAAAEGQCLPDRGGWMPGWGSERGRGKFWMILGALDPTRPFPVPSP